MNNKSEKTLQVDNFLRDKRYKTIIRHLYGSRKVERVKVKHHEDEVYPVSRRVTERNGLLGTVVCVFDRQEERFYLGASKVHPEDFGRATKKRGFETSMRRAATAALNSLPPTVPEGLTPSDSYTIPDKGFASVTEEKFLKLFKPWTSDYLVITEGTVMYSFMGMKTFQDDPFREVKPLETARPTKKQSDLLMELLITIMEDEMMFAKFGPYKLHP